MMSQFCTQTGPSMKHVAAVSIALVSCVSACSGETSNGAPSGTGPTLVTTGEGSTAIGSGGTGRTTGIGETGGSGGGASGGGEIVGPVGGAGGATAGGAGGLPCDVATTLRAKCQQCHAATPLNGAPMSLLTYADTRAAAPSNKSLSVWQSMQGRIHNTGMTVMPPRGQPALTTSELATLDAWFAAGAPAGSTACSGAATMGDGGMDGQSNMAPRVGPQYLPCTPNKTFTAHNTGSSTAKYPDPTPPTTFTPASTSNRRSQPENRPRPSRPS